MKKTIEIFIGGSTNKNMSESYKLAVMELGKIINQRKDYSIIFDSLNIDNIYYVTDNIIDSLNYIETELFKKESSYSQHFLQFMERKTPIIDESHSRIRKSC